MSKTWTKPVPNFQADLSRGRIGELAFIHACQGTVEPLDGREGDARVVGTRTKLEVKSDSYDMDRTTNFFMEKYRSGNRPGGVYQSLEHGCKYYIYIYVPNAEIFIFDCAALAERLDLLHDSRNLTLTSVGNGSYTTRGLKVHRDWVTDLMLNPDDLGIKFDKEKYEWYRDFNKATA
jgi:hypothetical protein